MYCSIILNTALSTECVHMNRKEQKCITENLNIKSEIQKFYAALFYAFVFCFVLQTSLHRKAVILLRTMRSLLCIFHPIKT